MATPPVLAPSQLGQLLKAARRARRCTQAELSQRVGVGQSRISSLELNAASMTVEQLLAWCAALGLELTLQPREPAPSPSGVAGAVSQAPEAAGASTDASSGDGSDPASAPRRPRSDDGAW